MGHVIAGIYELQEQIGAGGGGIVYLGRHLRLEKRIVLKADKRTLRTKQESLRREVDMLKELSHRYIPQVYDFIQENDVVYTVMDYIEGESLDKLLYRGERPSQPQVIRWGIQLLEALVYLHSQPPHGILHGDIKPSNIMLRPDGDICLIDYNIALALGENGAVRVGLSRGYASPEHYGETFGKGSSTDKTEVMNSVMTKGDERTALIGGQAGSMKKTEYLPIPEGGNSGTGSRPGVLLDVRSDIYSLGATLYHLLSGSRPPQQAAQVVPLGPESCSPAVAAIIEKAMAPDPGQRYQSAEEMLLAFRSLHRLDSRMIRRRRRMAAVAVSLTILFLTGGVSTFVGLKQMENRQSALALAEYSARELAEGNVSEAIRLALQAIPGEDSIWNAPVTAEARKALTDALGVYDLSERFRPLDVIALPSAPYKLSLSPDGSLLAAVCQQRVLVFDTDSGECRAELPAVNSALADAVFVDDNRLLYAGEQGVSLYDLGAGVTLWTGREATALAVSGDGRVAAAVNRDAGLAMLYQVADGKELGECVFDTGKNMDTVYNDVFADPGRSLLALNENGNMLAVSFSDGGLVVYDLDSPEDDLILYESSAYTQFEGGFSGDMFAFVVRKEDQSLFGLVDTVSGVYVGELESRGAMHLRADGRGIWLSEGNLLVRMDPETLEDQEMAFTDSWGILGFAADGGYVLTVTDDPGFSFYDKGANLMAHEETAEEYVFLALANGLAALADRDQPAVRLLKLDRQEDSRILTYDARYAHDEARLCQDGRAAMLFDYEGFRVYGRDGILLAEGDFPDAERIYDQQFHREDGREWLEVIWYDGTVRRYRGEDGTLLEETETEPPGKDLEEEFLTEKYRFVSRLHSAPQVYDRTDGDWTAQLEEDSYLTYVTEVKPYIVTEYVRASGERYGLLLDENLQTVAYLPGLCDVVNGTAVFDDKSGNLRQSRIYSLQELTALGETYKKEKKGEMR